MPESHADGYLWLYLQSFMTLSAYAHIHPGAQYITSFYVVVAKEGILYTVFSRQRRRSHCVAIGLIIRLRISSPM